MWNSRSFANTPPCPNALPFGSLTSHRRFLRYFPVTAWGIAWNQMMGQANDDRHLSLPAETQTARHALSHYRHRAQWASITAKGLPALTPAVSLRVSPPCCNLRTSVWTHPPIFSSKGSHYGHSCSCDRVTTPRGANEGAAAFVTARLAPAAQIALLPEQGRDIFGCSHLLKDVTSLLKDDTKWHSRVIQQLPKSIREPASATSDSAWNANLAPFRQALLWQEEKWGGPRWGQTRMAAAER